MRDWEGSNDRRLAPHRSQAAGTVKGEEIGTGKLKVQGTDDGNRSGHRRESRVIFTILIWYCMSWLTEEKREGFSALGP